MSQMGDATSAHEAAVGVGPRVCCNPDEIPSVPENEINDEVSWILTWTYYLYLEMINFTQMLSLCIKRPRGVVCNKIVLKESL